jgi:hypothetical protein
MVRSGQWPAENAFRRRRADSLAGPLERPSSDFGIKRSQSWRNV